MVLFSPITVAAGLRSLQTPTTEDLSEVWGSASDNIYAVGKGGTIIHYDGTSWRYCNKPHLSQFEGYLGKLRRIISLQWENTALSSTYDGSTWIKMDSGIQDSLISTFGTLNPRVMVVGYDGNILSLEVPRYREGSVMPAPGKG